MKSIRIRRGDLQVATHSFYNPITGRHFRIIGVCHLADEYFWHTTQNTIETFRRLLPKAEVHYEGVLPDHHKERPKPDKTFSKFSEAIGLIYQPDGLTYRPDWIRTDLTMSQILAKLEKPEKFTDSQNKLKETLNEMTEVIEDTPALATWVRRVMRYVIPYAHMFGRRGNEYSVVIDVRNRYAVSTMVSTGTDIITLWGAEHLKGIAKILTNCGYEHLHTTWNTCVPRQLPTR